MRGRDAGESQRQPATAYAAFSSSFHAEPAHQGKHRRAALPGASVAHERGERPVTRCHHGDEPGRAGYGYERHSPRAPPGAAASRPLANGSKRTQAGPCTWPAPPSPSARFLDGISVNTPRGRADDGAEAPGLRRRPVGRQDPGRHLTTPLTGLCACTQPSLRSAIFYQPDGPESPRY